MFKKKLNIPPPPKPPNLGQLEEDLNNTTHNDVVMLLKQRVEASQSSSEQSKDSDPDVVFYRVKSFIEANRDLQNILHMLEEQVQDLQATDTELKVMAEHIKKQAADARKITDLT